MTAFVMKVMMRHENSYSEGEDEIDQMLILK